MSKVCIDVMDPWGRNGGSAVHLLYSTGKGAKVARRTQNHAFDTLLEQNDVEVDQKTEPAPRQPKIRQQLRLMDRRQCVDFTSTTTTPSTIRSTRYPASRPERRIASALQFVREANLVGRLQQPRPERPMHGDGGADSGAPDPFRALRQGLVSFVHPWSSLCFHSPQHSRRLGVANNNPQSTRDKPSAVSFWEQFRARLFICLSIFPAPAPVDGRIGGVEAPDRERLPELFARGLAQRLLDLVALPAPPFLDEGANGGGRVVLNGQRSRPRFEPGDRRFADGHGGIGEFAQSQPAGGELDFSVRP